MTLIRSHPFQISKLYIPSSDLMEVFKKTHGCPLRFTFRFTRLESWDFFGYSNMTDELLAAVYFVSLILEQVCESVMLMFRHGRATSSPFKADTVSVPAETDFYRVKN